MQECPKPIQHNSNCDVFEKVERLVLQNRTEEMLNKEPLNTPDEGRKGGTEDASRSVRIPELDRLLSDARKGLEHLRIKLRELERNVERYKKEKLELEEKLEKERETNTKIMDELQSEKNHSLAISRDLASQKEYDLELAAEARKEKHRKTELLRDLEAERQFSAQLDVNCRDRKGNTALHRWALKKESCGHVTPTNPLL
jgi:chromosome segregation ATPase